MFSSLANIAKTGSSSRIAAPRRVPTRADVHRSTRCRARGASGHEQKRRLPRVRRRLPDLSAHNPLGSFIRPPLSPIRSRYTQTRARLLRRGSGARLVRRHTAPDSRGIESRRTYRRGRSCGGTLFGRRTLTAPRNVASVGFRPAKRAETLIGATAKSGPLARGEPPPYPSS